MKKKVFVATVEVSVVLITDGLNDATLDALDTFARIKNITTARIVKIEEK